MRCSEVSYKRQREASKYIVSICDLCVRARPDIENEDYKSVSVKVCPNVFCEGYREPMPRDGRHGVRDGCGLFAPDVQRIRSVMAHMALENAQGLAALDALLRREDENRPCGRF